MARITISKPIRMSQNSSFENFGDILSIKKITKVSVTALVSDLSTGTGSILSFTDIDNLKNTTEYSDILIGGTLYPRVRLEGFDLASGNLNKNAVVTISFSSESKNDSYLRALSGFYVDFAAAFNTTTAFLDDLNESVSISKGENSASYSKQLSLRFNNSVKFTGATDGAINAARKFVQAIFDYDATNDYNGTIPDVNITDSDTTLRDILDGSFKKFRSERINLITKECSFSENLDASNVKTTYSHQATQSFAIDSDGVATVSEKGSIQGLTAPLIDSANSGYSTEISSAQTRITALYNLLNECDSSLGSNSYISSSKTTNVFEGKIDYILEASNDERLANSASGVREERESTINTKYGIKTVTENGTITGIRSLKFNGSQSGFDRYPAYVKARNYYISNFSAIKTRVSGLIANPSPEYIDRSESHSPLKGSIQYSITYSSDPKFAENDTVKQFAVSSSIDKLKSKVNEFLILNDTIIPQSTAGNYEGTNGFSCNVIGYRLSPSMAGAKAGKASLMAFCKGKLAGLGDDNYLKSASYDFTPPNNVTFNLNAEYFELG